jgi:hypothetical protein
LVCDDGTRRPWRGFAGLEDVEEEMVVVMAFVDSQLYY